MAERAGSAPAPATCHKPIPQRGAIAGASTLQVVWETVDLREIRIFLALFEELHFSRTAQRLRLSQSRVSQSLRELEANLGSQLVERSSRRVELTAAGHELVALLNPIV